MSREDDLRAGLASVRERITAACRASGRDPSEITLIVVTKTFPAQDVRRLAALGVHDIGENRDQEAAAKVAECADLPLTWHFVGQVQTNKARSVARYADTVHSVDRGRLVTALSRAAVETGRRLACLVQVNLEVPLEDSPGRGGAAPAAVPALAHQIAAAPGLRLAGVMAVAPLERPPAPAFARLAEIAAELRADHPAATWVSAGMSDDLEPAVAHGATHVRVGSAILGARPPGG